MQQEQFASLSEAIPLLGGYPLVSWQAIGCMDYSNLA